MPPPPRRLTTNRFGCWAKVIALACVLLAALVLGIAQNKPDREFLSFSKAVDLALQHSGVMGIAALSQLRSQKEYQELHNNYFPQMTIGSGLGYAYGFP